MQNSSKGIEFRLQEDESTCGIALIRNILEHKFGIIKTEKELIELAEKIYEEKNKENIDLSYKILDNGTDDYHFFNIAEYYNLNTINSYNGDIEEIKDLLGKGLWLIVHRPFELDHDGHYVLVYGFGDNYLHLFDPAREATSIKSESCKDFYDKWAYPKNSNDPERWFIAFYK